MSLNPARPWASDGLTHDLVEGLAAVSLVLWCLAAGWPAVIGAFLACPGVPLVKAVIHQRAGNLWSHIVKDGIWEVLVWGAAWWVIYRGPTFDALATLALWWIVLGALRRYTKLGSP